MNNFIYEKLAVTNLKNNRKTYVPYIFTGVLTVMMFYIIDALSKGEGITQNTLKICLQYATGVIIVFAVIFLFLQRRSLEYIRKIYEAVEKERDRSIQYSWNGKAAYCTNDGS